VADLATTITEIGGPAVDALHPHLVDLYAACYGGPPWHETEDDVDAYASRIRRWAALDTFAGLVAHDEAGALVAACYGWQGPPTAGGIPLPGITAEEPFHVGDLMVHPTAQRRGLGRRLLDRLVAGRRPALLITHPESVSRRLYEAAGWRATGTLDLPHARGQHVVYTLD
jgi:GNAT superfamily N-acetyltransferase